MKINIAPYAQISNISINNIEINDIEKGVSDILNYLNILNNIIINNDATIDKINQSSRYRNTDIEKINNDEDIKKIIFNNAPKTEESYFLVPALIIRKS
jgi:aspartyl/glutamyl-tRNA(Asn/Gln) amidotransferase C subunit